MNLENKIVVISGVSKGIGEALCSLCLDSGAIVFGIGRNPYTKTHKNFHFIKTDVQQIDEVNAAFKTILEKTNQTIHVLINNAGLGYFGLIEELPISEWHEMVNTNVNALFYCTRLAAPIMKQQQEGHIINIASTAGLEGMPMVSGYCATKWAVKGFSESLWRELRDYKVKVTCIYPGSVKTDFFRNSPNIQPHDYMLMPEEVAQMIVSAIQTSENFHQVNIEVRPLQPKGPKTTKS